MKMCITGSRTWTNRDLIKETLEDYLHLLGRYEIAHGDCPKGVDALASSVGKELKIEVTPYPVDHSVDGPWPAAGPRRNQRMLVQFAPDLVLAFRSSGKSNGTDNCILEANKLKIPVDIIYENAK